MNELALFAGAGGGILASVLAGHRTVAAVEKDPFCREVLLRRQRDGVLPLFPIWDDIKTFDGRPWRGKVDIVTSGFPCQSHSQAGKRTHDPTMWEETACIIEEIRPSQVLIENVVGIKSLLPRLRNDLQRMGYCVSPVARVTASAMGAGHIRKRVFISTHSECESVREQSRWFCGERREEASKLERPVWWSREPELARVVHGLAHRVDRIRAIGNGQVPAVAREFL